MRLPFLVNGSNAGCLLSYLTCISVTALLPHILFPCIAASHFRLRLWGQVDSGVETRRFGDPPLLDTLSSDLLSVQDSSSQLKALGEESCSNSNTPKI